MDIGSKRTKHIVREIEICDLSGDSVRFEPAHDRVSRIHRLARDANSANALPDRLCRAGAVLFTVLSVLGLLIWGAVFRNATMVLATWGVLSVFIALPVLLTDYIRQTLGLASRLHKLHSVSLTLTPDRIILEMRRPQIFRGKHSPTTRREFLFSRISRLGYDRSSKTLRLSSEGMTGAAMDIVMFYDNSDAIIQEIEKRSGVFVHPAMQGNDYADLRDLSGLPKERNILRPMCIGVLGFCLVSLLTVLSIRAYNYKNPYMPYPKTDAAYLSGTFGIGSTVTLDGCGITLTGVSKAGSDIRGVCYQFIVTFNNKNSSAIRLRSNEPYKDSFGNILFSAADETGEIFSLETSGPPLGHVGVNLPLPKRISGGRSESVTFFVWVPDNAQRVTMTVNSDYWPPADVFRDVTYSGATSEINGLAVKSNEVRFAVSRAVLER
jgi:hypothetical protein